MVMSRELVAENHFVRKMNLLPCKITENFLVRNTFKTYTYMYFRAVEEGCHCEDKFSISLEMPLNHLPKKLQNKYLLYMLKVTCKYCYHWNKKLK